MKTAFLCAAAVLGLALVETNQVEAGHGCGYGYGYGGYGYGSYYGGYYNSYPRWHNTSHYDYYVPSFRPHYHHYHYVPGHYHFHPSGHWDF